VFSDLYRLVDVCAVRDVRVSIPAAPGLFKAVKLATSLRLPIRILPGQPTAEVLSELSEILEFYLHRTMVEAPVEFFHSLLASACGANSGSIWTIVEEDPAAFLHYDDQGNPRLPRSSKRAVDALWLAEFVERPKHLVENEDCLSCRYLSICHGGCPVRAYSAKGTIMAKDPYCEVYKVVFARAEKYGREVLVNRLGKPQRIPAERQFA
jgi:sulfatase maturation enzyme AslB (radical SAM superfamily)